MKNRILSLLLALLFVVSALPAPAYAEEDAEPVTACEICENTPCTCNPEEEKTITSCEVCGNDPCSCDPGEETSVTSCEICGKDPCICQSAGEETATIWDRAGEAESVCLIGFIDKTAEVTFFDDSAVQQTVAAADCPDYLVLHVKYPDKESGEALFYTVDSFDADFYDSTLAYYSHVEAKYFSKILSAAGLYAVLPSEGSVTLYKDLTVLTDGVSVDVAELAAEYAVEEFYYDISDPSAWFFKLTPDEAWPENAAGYVWVNSSHVVKLSQTATVQPEEPVEPEEPGDTDDGTLTECTLEAVTGDTKVTVSGEMPGGTTVSIKKVNGSDASLSQGSQLYGAYDIKLLDKNGKQWQYTVPEVDGKPVQSETAPEEFRVSLTTADMGLTEGQRVRIRHTHGKTTDDLGIFTVQNGLLSFSVPNFSVITVESVSSNSAEINGIIYLDLNAGNITVDANKNYTGYRFDGSSTPTQFAGTVAAGQKFYIYQSFGANAKDTGLITSGTQQLVLPDHDRVADWASYITDNTDVNAVIAQWNTRAPAAGRQSTPNWITVSGYTNMDITMILDNLWSSYAYKSASKNSGGVGFVPLDTSVRNAKLTLKAKGDNRFGNIYYQARSDQNCRIIFDGEADSTLTVANLTTNADTNWWCAGIGASDSADNAAGIVINSGVLFVGTTTGDDCTAIGGGGNGYGEVTINGGTVTAVASSSGTAIGGGIGKTSAGGQAKVVITGGKVYAYNFSCLDGGYSQSGVKYIPAAAIGGGSSARATCNPSTVQITGGYVFARSVAGTAIGGGSSADNHGGNSTVIITGGTVDAASISGKIGSYNVRAGAAIGGGTGGTKGNGGNCNLTISGSPVIYTGSIGGGKTINPNGTIGAATVNISGGTMQGQVIMAKGASTNCAFNMTGGVIDNTAAMSGAPDEQRDIVFTRGTGKHNTYTFLEENGGAAYVENGTATLSGTGIVRNVKATNGGAFYVTGGNFNMTGGTIAGFQASDNGGAIAVVDGTATVGGTITGSNAVTEAVKGGAAYVGGGSFTMTGGSITDSNASEMGGAVCVEKTGSASGTATVEKGAISNVTAPNGGAIAITGGNFTMTGGSISNVTASSDGVTVDGNGGAVYVKDGAALVSGGSVTGQATTPEAANGGGVYVEGGSFTMTDGAMENFNVTGNGGMVAVHGGNATIRGGTLTGNPAAGVDEAAKGGAVYVGAGGKCTIDGQGKIADCNATESGGGVYLDDGTFILSGGSFTSCSAPVSGGGVYLGSGSFRMDGGEFVSCTTAGNGGGVYLGGGELELSGGSFESCTASGNGGGGYLADGNMNISDGQISSCSAQNGGGIYLAGGGLTMEGGRFDRCKANADGGAICIMNGQADILDGAVYADAKHDTLEAVRGGGIFLGGGTLNMDSGTITRCAATSGGAVYVMNGICNMRGGSVVGNFAQNDGGIYVNNTSVNYGGASNITVEFNSAAKNGGGLYIDNAAGKTTTIMQGHIRSNDAGLNGGGIYHTGQGGVCTVSGTGQIRLNTARNGGGLYVTGGSSLMVNGGHICDNKAVYPAGFQQTQRTANVANDADNTGVGGGVYVGKGASVSSNFAMSGENVGIYNNQAEFAADDVYANKSATVLKLPKVDQMQIPDGFATGWYEDYAEGDTDYSQGFRSNPDISVANPVQRYRDVAASGDTTNYKVKDSDIVKTDGITGVYVCLSIGQDIINFGKLVIGQEGAVSEDQYFVYRVTATELVNEKLEKFSFDVAVKGNGSVTIDRVPFGTYAVTEVESWSWRYEGTDRSKVTQTVKLNDANAEMTVTFSDTLHITEQFNGNRWLDGNGDSRVNIWNVKQEVAG